jgi:predicted DNA-binding transcriptional regulator AlpA
MKHTQQTETKSSTDKLRFIGPRRAEEKTGLSRWTLWRKENDGTFPKSMKVGNKRLWIETEIEDWMRARIAERG